MQQPDWIQTGNTVNQSIVSSNVTVALNNFVYAVSLPNDAPATADGLYFGNFCRFDL